MAFERLFSRIIFFSSLLFSNATAFHHMRNSQYTLPTRFLVRLLAMRKFKFLNRQEKHAKPHWRYTKYKILNFLSILLKTSILFVTEKQIPSSTTNPFYTSCCQRLSVLPQQIVFIRRRVKSVWEIIFYWKKKIIYPKVYCSNHWTYWTHMIDMVILNGRLKNRMMNL